MNKKQLNHVGGENSKILESNTVRRMDRYEPNHLNANATSAVSEVLESSSSSMNRVQHNNVHASVPGVNNEICESSTLTSNPLYTNVSGENSEMPAYSNTARNRKPYHLFMNVLNENFETLDLNRKPIDNLYANVINENSEDFAAQNEPTYSNTVNNNHTQLPSQTIYSNVNYQRKPENVYSNIDEMYKPISENAQYPLYQNLVPLGKDHLHSSQSPVSSRNDIYVNYNNDTKDLENKSLHTSKMYESAIKPIDADYPSPEDVMYLMFDNESLKPKKANCNPHTVKRIMCTKCNKMIFDESLRCIAMDNNYHFKCFKCTKCGIDLTNSSFRFINTMPYCEKDYFLSLKRCAACENALSDQVMKSLRCLFHLECFHCVVCFKVLLFAVDSTNQIRCIDDYNDEFVPEHSADRYSIKPEDRQEETMRSRSLDRAFHRKCSKCADYGMFVRSK